MTHHPLVGGALREIAYGSAAYAAACRLRQEVLRTPLGLRLADEDLRPERQQLHFGWFTPQNELLACVIAAPQDPSAVKLRQMAVAAALQRQGVGRALLEGVEGILAEHGVRQLMLHARLSAVGFYQRLGYQEQGEIFDEIGLPHRAMHKRLGLRNPPAVGSHGVR